jgi:hypothetical protein
MEKKFQLKNKFNFAVIPGVGVVRKGTPIKGDYSEHFVPPFLELVGDDWEAFEDKEEIKEEISENGTEGISDLDSHIEDDPGHASFIEEKTALPDMSWSKEHLMVLAEKYNLEVSKFDKKKTILDAVVKKMEEK